MAGRQVGLAMAVLGVQVLTGEEWRRVLGEQVGCSSVMAVMAVPVVMRWEVKWFWWGRWVGGDTGLLGWGAAGSGGVWRRFWWQAWWGRAGWRRW